MVAILELLILDNSLPDSMSQRDKNELLSFYSNIIHKVRVFPFTYLFLHIVFPFTMSEKTTGHKGYHPLETTRESLDEQNAVTPNGIWLGHQSECLFFFASSKRTWGSLITTGGLVSVFYTLPITSFINFHV